MNNYDKNLNNLISYFKSGIKEEKDKSLGVELEHFIVKKSDLQSVDYYEKNGIKDILNLLSPYFDKKIYKDGNLIGLSKDKSNISLEPASQIEISIGPFVKIEDILEEYNYFLLKINPILNKLGYKIVYSGYQPKSKIEDLNLIPKKRYEYMLNYFSKSGNYGKNMMKGSGSTQVSVDYFSEEDFKRKFRLANILSPLISLMTDNTAVFEGKVYKDNCARVKIWNDVDKDRSMIVKGALDKSFGFREYAEYILNSPAILVEDENGNSVYTGDKKIKDIYCDKEMGIKEIEHVLSMFFPDVRLKSYVEIRMADCMPICYSLSYAAIIKGIFYGYNALGILLERFKNIRNEDVAKAKINIMKEGYDANVYGVNVKTLLCDIIKLAKENLHEDEKDRVSLFFELASKGLTLKMINEREMTI